ncbi:dihydroorotase [Alphaproteobacteria bacterium LSUCC0744]
MTATRLFNAHLIDPSQSLDGIGYLDVIDGVVDAIGRGTPPNSGKFDQLIDCKKSCLSPGIVDMRVQPADPGAEHLESLSTLLAAAAGGGVTALACLPDTRPVIDEASAIDSLCLRASRIGGPRLYAYGAATKGLAGHEMAELGLMAEAGAVGFTNSATSINDSLIMRRLLAYSNMLDKPFIQHCEDHALTKDAEMNEGETSTRLGLLGSPSEAEVIIIDRDLHLLRRTGARYHVAHISTRAGIEAVREAKAEGLAVTADTAPPYFLLNELAISTYNTAFKLSPPLRSEDDRQAVIEGLVDGTIDAIASDHMPVDRDAKMQPFGPAQPGASGLDTLLSLSLTLVHQGQISMPRMIEALSLAPASILDIPGGTLTPGSSADFILFRPDSSWIVKSANFRSNSRITPFESHPVQGIVDATYVDGTAIFLRD